DAWPSRRVARNAGLLYLVMALLSIVALQASSSLFAAPADGAATVRNVLASETLFRWGIVSELAGGIVFVLLALELSKLVAPLGESLAGLMRLFVYFSV